MFTSCHPLVVAEGGHHILTLGGPTVVGEAGSQQWVLGGRRSEAGKLQSCLPTCTRVGSGPALLFFSFFFWKSHL